MNSSTVPPASNSGGSTPSTLTSANSRASPLSRAGGPKLAQYQAAGLPYGPANRPFDSLDELGLVLGMTPTLLARMRPFLSVYQEGDTPDKVDYEACARVADGVDHVVRGLAGIP